MTDDWMKPFYGRHLNGRAHPGYVRSRNRAAPGGGLGIFAHTAGALTATHKGVIPALLDAGMIADFLAQVG